VVNQINYRKTSGTTFQVRLATHTNHMGIYDVSRVSIVMEVRWPTASTILGGGASQVCDVIPFLSCYTFRLLSWFAETYG
jgi:hypothetical protein